MINTRLFLQNLSQAFIFSFEISGQISDGHWENARPYDHWEWVCHTGYVFGDYEPCYNGVQHRKYAITNFVKKYNDTLLKNRIYRMAKMGKAFESLDNFPMEIEEALKNDDLGYIAEDMSDEFVTFEEYYNNASEYRKKSIKESKITEELYNKFYEIEYSKEDFMKDVKNLDKAVNNWVGYN